MDGAASRAARRHHGRRRDRDHGVHTGRQASAHRHEQETRGHEAAAREHELSGGAAGEAHGLGGGHSFRFVLATGVLG